MATPIWWRLDRLAPVRELSRDGAGGSSPPPASDDRLRKPNALTGDAALAAVLALRASSGAACLPDSTPAICADRDGR